MKHYSLLLSSSYEPLKFLPERRVIKLFFNEKVDVINNWNYKLIWANGSMPLPSIIKLKTEFRRDFKRKSFDRLALIKRDDKTCQYCGMKLSIREITIDHVVPVSAGGKNSFTNCVVACKPCNDYKSNIPLEKCGLKLIRSPKDPNFSPIYSLPMEYKKWNKDWDYFIQ